LDEGAWFEGGDSFASGERFATLPAASARLIRQAANQPCYWQKVNRYADCECDRYCRPVKDLSPRIHRCPERPGCAAQKLAQPAQLPDPLINWDQTRQTQGRDVSRKQNNERRRGRWSQTVIVRETSPADTENVFVLISRGARDPYPALFASINIQFTVAGASGDSARAEDFVPHRSRRNLRREGLTADSVML